MLIDGIVKNVRGKIPLIDFKLLIMHIDSPVIINQTNLNYILMFTFALLSHPFEFKFV